MFKVGYIRMEDGLISSFGHSILRSAATEKSCHLISVNIREDAISGVYSIWSNPCIYHTILIRDGVGLHDVKRIVC